MNGMNGDTKSDGMNGDDDGITIQDGNYYMR
jgi:hypothetical protein